MLPYVKGLSGIDVGRGEGASARLFGKKGTDMTAIDIVPPPFFCRPLPGER
ncbi:MAG: hypothetical protein OXI87_04455 [Albidovulum sp.]|nr:hypothetical protein [Albidovulum sp.]MDE0304127.1 hypothetical protein [Albidovulum sp.]